MMVRALAIERLFAELAVMAMVAVIVCVRVTVCVTVCGMRSAVLAMLMAVRGDCRHCRARAHRPRADGRGARDRAPDASNRFLSIGMCRLCPRRRSWARLGGAGFWGLIGGRGMSIQVSPFTFLFQLLWYV